MCTTSSFSCAPLLTVSGTYDFDLVKNTINSEFEDSVESLYWKKRENEGFKKKESYHSYKNRCNVGRKKRLCNERTAFKKSKKWYGYDDEFLDYAAFQYEKDGLIMNKASHNKVFCACCSKTKVLFESKSQADNFIRFNHESILLQNGYAPIRSYYCSLCGGWHVTSMEESEHYGMMSTAEKIIFGHNKDYEHICAQDGNQQTEDEEMCEETKSLSNEEYRILMIKEIKSLFNHEMDAFFEAYRNKQLETCVSIHKKVKDCFSKIDIEDKEIEKIKVRIGGAQKNIDKLSSIMKEEEQQKRLLVWGIKQAFKKQYELFVRAFALRKVKDCHQIYNKVKTIIESSSVSMPFMSSLKEKLDDMKSKILTLEAAYCLPNKKEMSESYLLPFGIAS